MDFRPYRFHVAIVLFLLLLQFFLPSLWTLAYRHLRRPALLASGGRSCEGYTPEFPRGEPRAADIVVRRQFGNVVAETFYTSQGEQIETVRSLNHHWLGSEGTYALNKAALVIPFFGFVAGFIATLHKVFRTRSIFTWQLSRHRSDQLETVLYLYAVPLFLSGIVFPLFRNFGAG